MTNKKESEYTERDLFLIYSKTEQAKNNDFFGSDRHEELHWGKMFYSMFGEFFSKFRYTIDSDYIKIVEDLKAKYNIKPVQLIKIKGIEKLSYSGYEIDRAEYVLIPYKSLMITVYDGGILIYYGHKISEKTIMEIKEIADKHWIKKEIKKSFQMITSNDRGLDLTDFDLQDSSLDVNYNYNDDFIEIDKIIKKSITENDKKGLILLHGIPGTGKTSYIRHLISNITNKQFIYLPNYMIDSLNSPNFLPFISKYINSVLILEDCENAVMHRDNSQANKLAVSSLLNLGDGLLGDALSLQVICTFNTQLQKIDDALLRKGRLIARYEFKELETYKCQHLANKLGKDVIINKPMTLAEIYNIDTKSFETQKMKKVGFSVN